MISLYDVIIIGAGPSGLMTAIAVANNLKILILEKNNIAGKKMLLTGGGRCNLTNLKSNNVFLDVIEYNKKYLYSAINKFGPSEICNFFETNGVLLKEEKDNQIFPISDKASSIVNFLVNSLDNVKINYNEFVTNIINNGKIKEIQTNKGEYFTSNIVIATGGNSYQKTGSCGDHMKFAKMLKQPTISLYPAEVGIILEEELDLAGTAVENVEIIYKNYKKKDVTVFFYLICAIIYCFLIIYFCTVI
ncbi:MAG: aminoacetone oxidase family FAD-binding enzyme [Bacilli bacterium]